MPDLQNLFYMIAIAYMCLMTLVLIGLGIGLLVLRSKLKRAMRKLDTAKRAASKAEYIFKTVKYFVKV